MVIVIAHHDADGMFSLAFIYKKYGDEVNSVYFTSPYRLKKTICKAVVENEPNNRLFICDLSGNQSLLRLASYFDEVYWIDHHVWPKVEVPSNVNLLVKESDSAASLVADFLDVKDEELIQIANNVDTNRVNDEKSLFFRDLVGAIKWKFPKDQYKYFNEIARSLAFEGVNKVVGSPFYRVLVEDFRNWLKNKELDILFGIRVYDTRKGKALFILCKDRIPTYYVMDILNRRLKEKYDYVFVVYQNNLNTRIEMRTQTGKNVSEIAMKLGGGGRPQASGVTLKNILPEEAMDMVLKYLNDELVD